MNKKLVLISIAGVQNFIEQSRGTKDFFINSKLIVDYVMNIHKGVKAMTTIEEMNTIIPLNLDSEYGIPNYLLFECESETIDLENEIREYLEGYFENEKTFLRNVAQELDVFIVAENYINEDYRQIYIKVYEKLELLKKDRFVDRRILKEVETKEIIGQKCTLCHKREGTEDNGKEILCSICSEKRVYIKEGYPSTELIANFKKDCKNNYYNNNIKSDCVEIKPKENKYYALIRGDIDDFGKHIAGLYLEKESDLIKHQQALNNEINTFACKLKNALDESIKYNNEIKKFDIYLGGDDFIFFCPLIHLFEMLEKIEMQRIQIFEKESEREITFSKSVMIAHSSTDLKEVIKYSKERLEFTKEKLKKQGKNGLAISLLTMNHKFRTSTIKGNQLKLVKDLYDEFEKGMSQSIIQELERTLRLLGDTIQNEYYLLNSIIENETYRIISKKSKASQEMIKLVIALLEQYKTYEHRYTTIDWDGYFNMLKIIERISKKEGTYNV
ncbi:CRISPR-associated protein Cmr2 [Natranaerovirga hydrolytica]|uniref:CRISPR-associated protein Cmr2 n=1 Tax=Natranaerovirga hydrolytica TaxID=680378 RepID=A0A4R1N3N7_9FIRM|nr:type III-B CRISPR-associated protein Cas10/Cmr2 [Natranaerovirga hydrolytica]TCK98674.1 CRISPR-associated protein Cmr2 [Natranaerovirga hydrolytica]